MDLKPMEKILCLERENVMLKYKLQTAERNISELISKSASKSAELDEKLSQMQLKISNQQHEILELKRKNTNFDFQGQSFDPQVIDLDSEDEPQLMVEIAGDKFPKKLPFECTMCNKSYVHAKRLQTHKQRRHKDQLNSNQVPVQNYRKVYECPDCVFTTTFYPSFVRHKKIHDENYIIRCEYPGCNYSITSQKRFINHMTKKHDCVARINGSRTEMVGYDPPPVPEIEYGNNYTFDNGASCSNIANGYLN